MSPRWTPWVLSLMAACQLQSGAAPSPAATPDDPQAGDSSANSRTPTISSGAVVETIAYLASDELAGRYTLSPEIETAAQWLASQYRDAGLQSLGGELIVPYALNVGAKEAGAQALVVHTQRGAKVTLDRKDFAPLPYSGNGEVKAPAVFVGYGLTSEPSEDGSIAYDDFAGVDLEGKVAVLFSEAPGQPNYREAMAFFEAEAKAFAAAAGPLVDAGDRKGMEKLHRQARERIAEGLTPFLRGKKLPDSYWDVSDPMIKELDVFRLLGPVMRMAREAEGPRFGRARLQDKIERLAEAKAVEDKALAYAADSKELQWGPCPEMFPEGCMITVAHGNPAEPNADVLFKVPAKYEIPHHWHTSAERMVLVKGEMDVEYDGQERTTVKHLNYAYGPSKAPHKAWCGEGDECILFIAFEEPVDAHPHGGGDEKKEDAAAE